VTARIDVGSTEQAGILATAGAVWVAVYGAGDVVRIDPRTNDVAAWIHVGGNPEDVLSLNGSLWVPNENGTLARVDPRSRRVTATVRVGADPDNIAVCRGRIWTSSLRGPSLVVVDPSTARVTARMPVGVGSVGLACGRALWVANYDTGELLRIDPVRRVVTGRASVGVRPRTVLISAGTVWVANQGSGSVSRVRGG
jgi:streptogramin lyase